MSREDGLSVATLALLGAVGWLVVRRPRPVPAGPPEPHPGQILGADEACRRWSS